MEPDGSPPLPPELERKIFEICTYAQPVSIPNLMLVAARVKEWLEPLLYVTIVVEGDLTFQSMKELPRVTIKIMLSIIQAFGIYIYVLSLYASSPVSPHAFYLPAPDWRTCGLGIFPRITFH
ncbi:hypothetical protein B0H19DRAFT_1254249 [Mycena capillaripes]|nr:hypothetical protein B0H19DRAFT_1254249 [Mycena capillaripes]